MFCTTTFLGFRFGVYIFRFGLGCEITKSAQAISVARRTPYSGTGREEYAVFGF